MLGTRSVVTTLASKDVDRSKAFFTDTLGLKEVGSKGDDMIFFKSGDSMLKVYQSDYAGTNQADVVSWPVDDIDKEVAALKTKGVTFEHYDDIPGLEVQGDIHVGDGIKMAWFKDPDGNILHIVEESA